MVLCHFGTEKMRDGISTKWKHLFYSNGPTTRANTGSMTILDESVATVAKRECQVQEHNAHHEQRYGMHHNTFDFDILSIPYLLVPPEELQAKVKAAREDSEEEKAEVQIRNACRIGLWSGLDR
jgi:hypothetical protein